MNSVRWYNSAPEIVILNCWGCYCRWNTSNEIFFIGDVHVFLFLDSHDRYTISIYTLGKLVNQEDNAECVCCIRTFSSRQFRHISNTTNLFNNCFLFERMLVIWKLYMWFEVIPNLLLLHSVYSHFNNIFHSTFFIYFSLLMKLNENLK